MLTSVTCYYFFYFLYQSAHFASICEKCVMLLLCIQVPYMYIDIYILHRENILFIMKDKVQEWMTNRRDILSL